MWEALAVIIPSICTILGTLLIAWMQAKTKTAVEVTGVAAAQKVEEVKTTLVKTTTASDAKLTKIAKVGDDTHTLVNSNMGVQLKLGMDLSDFKAKTTKLPEDIAAAKLAREKHEEHVKKQAIVDRGSKTEVSTT